MGTQQPEPPVPADALMFDFPRSLAPMMFGGSILFFALGSLVVVLEITQPTHGSLAVLLLCVAVCVPMSVLSLRSALRLRDRIAVNAEGIWYLARKDHVTFIAWSDVARVKANDTEQRLIVSDSTADKRIRLEYQLENFGKLRDFIVSHAKLPSVIDLPLDGVFHRTWLSKALLGVFSVGPLWVAWISHQQGQTGPSLVFVALSGFMLLLITQDPLRVCVGRDAVVIFYPGWKRTIAFAEVTAIALKDMSSRGNSWAVVVIERRQGKPIVLSRFREGSLALRDALEAAWSAASQTR